MAKKSMIARDVKREKLVEKYFSKRQELKKRILVGDLEAINELNKLPKDSSSVRKRNRCQIDGRPRGYMREFGISRVKFRQLAGAGLIPGIKKSSW
ncbi:MAG: 30S ribosomal protein S14 [Fusobacteriaceae bacterium]|jgi:small subunit ribosomal protein S14|nr:30S ribosomal protein S14 [Fusobacteriaceae bacterium]